MKFTVSADRRDEKNVAETIRYQWTRNVLEMTGIDWEDCFDEDDDDGNLSILQKGKIRKKLKVNNLFIKDDREGGRKIYIDKEVIAEWEKPLFVLNYDHSEIDPKKKTYVTIQISCWSVFDEEFEDQEDEDEDIEEEYD